MSSRRNNEDRDLQMMQQRIDEGILLAQQRLLIRAQHDGLSLVVCQGGVVREIPAEQISWDNP